MRIHPSIIALPLCLISIQIIQAHGDDRQSSRTNDNETIGRTKPRKKLNLIGLIFADNNITKVELATCKWLRGYRKQAAQCANRRGFARVLHEARSLAVAHCREQFAYDRWDCSRRRGDIFARVYRETAFMQALSGAALMYTVAKACSDGKLQSCYCSEKPRRGADSKWHWVGCGDNTKVARRITRRFLAFNARYELDAEEDTKDPRRLQRRITQNNIDVGMRTVQEHKINVCVCHGVSATCTLKTCWKVIKRAFSEIADALKAKYYEADVVKTVPATNDLKLLYTALSPNFCDGTHGRRCREHNHCATLCCGRGYFVRNATTTKRCNCVWDELDVNCSVCSFNEDHLICK